MEKKSIKMESKTAELIYRYYKKFPNLAIEKIAAFFNVSRQKVDDVINYNIMKDNAKINKEFERAVKVVEKYEGVNIDIILGRSRKVEVIQAKRFLVALLRDNSDGFSFKHIGTMLGGLDHSTVIHHINTHNDYYDTNKQYREKYNRMKSEFLMHSEDIHGIISRKQDDLYVVVYKTKDNRYFKQVVEDLMIASTFEPDWCVELSAEEANQEKNLI